MATIKISALTQKTTLSGTEEILINDSGTSKKISTQKLLIKANNLSDLADASTALSNLGISSSSTELNILDGATVSTTELNLLDGLTVTTNELNLLAGSTGGGSSTNLVLSYEHQDDITGTGSTNNTAVGYQPLLQATTNTSYNTAIGSQSQVSATSGADNNTAVGYKSLYRNVSGDENVAIGVEALNGSSTVDSVRNTGIGYKAGSNITTGTNNICIGHQAYATSATASNQLNIGDLIYASGGNVGIGDTAPAEALSVVGNIKTTGNLFLTQATGHGSLEVGGPSGGLLDLKTPFSDDYDFRFQHDGTDNVIYSASTIPLKIYTNGSQRMHFDSTGNVGIANSSPTQKLDVTGTVKATAFSGDGSALTNLPAAGGTITAVASGALANGDTIILQSDGTVKSVGLTTYSESLSNSEYVFETDIGSNIWVAYDPFNSNKFVVVWKDDYYGSDYARICTGTISGTTISFGTETTFNSFATNTINNLIADQVTEGRYVVQYKSDEFKVITLSGTTFTIGAEYTANAMINYPYDIAFDPNNANTFMTVSTDNSYKIQTSVVTISSSTVLSFGTVQTHSSSANNLPMAMKVMYNRAGDIIISWANNDASQTGQLVRGAITSSGATVTYDSYVTYDSVGSVDNSTSYGGSSSRISETSTDGKYLIAYSVYNGTRWTPCSRIATNEGGTWSVGTLYSVSVSVNSKQVSASVESSFDKFLMSYVGGSSGSYGTCAVGTISGTTITYGTPVTLNAATSHYTRCYLDPHNSGKYIVGYKDDGNTDNGTLRIAQISGSETNVTADNFIGISDGAYADTTTATIQVVGGTDDAQSGLTVGSKHYVQNDGTLSTTADSPSVYAGMALSSTSLLIKG